VQLNEKRRKPVVCMYAMFDYAWSALTATLKKTLNVCTFFCHQQVTQKVKKVFLLFLRYILSRILPISRNKQGPMLLFKKYIFSPKTIGIFYSKQS
jgi:hypothetical protein